MATRNQKFKAGLFLATGTILLLVIFFVVYSQGKKTLREYQIKFQESVAGLRKDSDVLFQGVPIGKVINIYVDGKNEIVTHIGIDPTKITLREGVTAKLDIGNIMGGAVIELSGGDLNKPILPPDSLIPATPGILSNLTEDLPKILGDIRNILKKIDTALGDVQNAEIPRVIGNMDLLVKTATDTLQEINYTLISSQGTVKSMEREVILTLSSLRQAILPTENAIRQIANDPSSLIRGRELPAEPYVR